MHLALKAELSYEGVVGGVAVMDDPRAPLDVRAVGLEHLACARVPDAARDEHADFSVGHRGHAELVPRQPGEPLPPLSSVSDLHFGK